MRKFLYLTVLLSSCLLLVNGCARRIGCSNLANVHFLGTVADLNNFAYKVADNLILHANPFLVQYNPKMPILVTSFVDLNDLTQTNGFGRIMQRAVASRFVQQEFTVREILLGDSIFIEPRHGETVLTRDLARLANDHTAQAVVVGTWSRTGRTLYISVRAVNPVNSQIISSQDYYLCMDDDILELFNLKEKEKNDGIVEPHEPWLNKIFPILNF